MNRRKFIYNLGSPVFAACAVCLAGCGKSADTPNNSSGSTTPAGTVNFTVDLGSQLVNIGSSLVQAGVIVVRLAAGNTSGSFTAVQVACTHQGISINYVSSANDFECPAHGSRFTTDGAVINGPAASALTKFSIRISGNTMTVSN